MQIAIISAFVLCFVGLCAAGIAFAVRGVKIANGEPEKELTIVRDLEKSFRKLGKQCENRCVMYVGLSVENLHDIHLRRLVLSEIRKLLLQHFADGQESAVALYEENDHVVLSTWPAEEVRERVETYQEELRQCLLKYSVLNVVSAKLGICYAEGTSLTFSDAVNRASQALIMAKKENVPYMEWDINNGTALEKRIKIENTIEKEIESNNFYLVYQPILDAKTRKIIGAEVLSRLNAEDGKVVQPGGFLPAVDAVGINNKFDYYIFEKNCKWISKNRPQREKYTYTINFSRATLCDPAFADKILQIAESYDLKFSCLAVEILEDKNLEGKEQKQMMENLKLLKEKGVSVLLDDFGHGATTFCDLENVTVSIVKVDKSVTQAATSKDGFAILENIIRIAHELGFEALCEGIETQAQEDAVIAAGCDFLQGFYYYRPMPVASLEELLHNS